MKGSIYNIPYKNADPFELIFKQNVVIDYAGNFVFPLNKTPPIPDINLLLNALYFIHEITFAADIAEGDYQGSILVAPVFSLYISSDAYPVLKNPIDLPKYFNGILFRKGVLNTQSTGDGLMQDESHFQGSFQGTLMQTPPLIGKQDITLTMIFSIEEINDRDFILAYNRGILS
jgi:hypothetical protein